MIPLRDVCKIERPTRTADKYGGYTETFVTIYATRSCQYIEKRSVFGVSVAAERPLTALQHVLLLALGTDIREDDKVTVRGQSFRVETVLTRRGVAHSHMSATLVGEKA